MPGGRPKGTKNTPGHSAGGRREGAGRKEKVNVFLLAFCINLMTIQAAQSVQLADAGKYFSIITALFCVIHRFFCV